MIMKEKMINFFKEIKIPFSWGRIWLTVGIITLSIVLAGMGILLYSFSYFDRVYPNVYVGEIGVGGMHRGELKDFLQKMDDKLVRDGMRFNYLLDSKKESFVIYPLITFNGDSAELVAIDLDKEVENILAFKKGDEIIDRLINLFTLFWRSGKVSLQTVKVDVGRLKGIINDNLKQPELLPKNAGVQIKTLDPLDYEITSEQPGIVYDFSQVAAQVNDAWVNLQPVDVKIEKKNKNPEITKKEVKEIIPRLGNVFKVGNLDLIYNDSQTKQELNWKIGLDKISRWINVQKVLDNGLAFGLDKEKVIKYVELLSQEVNVEPQNARFKVGDDGKVQEFEVSRPGIAVNLEKTYEVLNQAVLERIWRDQGLTKSVTMAVDITEPNIKTGDVNDLGIKEILGVGISDYSNSPTNRIKNIRNAVNKLNGILIKPDEEFSALKYTAPFTKEGGYLPELVIKGDEIKPEIGGGLCQIGTTLFRMAMNSGMPITQRQNHSLVVFHYNDPVNHSPGTDATVYDPAPDFRFKNDTGRYLLIQTAMNTKKQLLLFSLWGTSDGRKGSYTHPKVSRWIPYDPEVKEVETTKLDPGKKECQNAFKGADASFTYMRILPNGQTEERVFESHYRALPKICLVGSVTSTSAVSGVTTSSLGSVGLEIPVTVE